MIKLYSNYGIIVDDNSYALCYFYGKQDKNGKEMYRNIGYYTDIDKALKAFGDELVHTKLKNGVYDLSEAVRIIKESNEELVEYIKASIPKLEVPSC